MARRAQENPELDMTPMIDVVFELIIFFVVTLTEANKKDETIQLEDGRNGIILTADELPPGYMVIDVAKEKKGEKYGRISMGDVTMTPEEVYERVTARRKQRGGAPFPILIRADFETKHDSVRRVMDACTKAQIWQLSFVAISEDLDKKHPRTRLAPYRAKKGK
ncbi:MAG: ExbD/TolR family protein [Kiritimatiellia bacterium]